MISITDVRRGDFVKKRDGTIHEIKEIWGVAGQSVAPPSQGGFGVITITGERIDMWHAAAYIKRQSTELKDTELKDIELYAWLGEDEFGSGRIGLKQGTVPAGTIPMVVIGDHLAKLEKYWPQAEEQALNYGKKIHLCRFKLVEVIRETKKGD